MFKNILKKSNFILGIISVLITIQAGWFIGETTRKILITIVPLINKILLFFPKLFLGIDYGFWDFVGETIIIYAGSGAIYSFIVIFVPILLFEKIFKKKINWKPAIYLLLVCFIGLEIASDVRILNTVISNHPYPFIAKIIPIIAHGFGLFGMLYLAYVHVNADNIKNE